jgi:DNA-binding SARP family transcriptional activator
VQIQQTPAERRPRAFDVVDEVNNGRLTAGRIERPTDPARNHEGDSVADLQVRLFGEISVRRHSERIEFGSAKVLELLCFLLLHRGSPNSRETVSEALWPAANNARAKGYLRQALWGLRSTLDERLGKHSADLILLIDADWMRVDADGSWWLDVSVFDRTYLSTRDTPGHRLSDEQAGDIEAALDLYRGDLMTTWYHDWCIFERELRQRSYLAMLEQLMGYCEAHRLHARGIDYGELILRREPARESTHRQLMRLHHGAGDRTAALRQFHRCTAALHDEFEIAPSTETVSLIEQIRTDRVLDLSNSSQAGAPDHHEYDPLAGVHARLDQLQAGLAELHHAVVANPLPAPAGPARQGG